MDPIEFRNWSGARDLNPGPHGPEIYAISSTEIDFEGFELNSMQQRAISVRFQPLASPGLLHELLHEKVLFDLLGHTAAPSVIGHVDHMRAPGLLRLLPALR